VSTLPLFVVVRTQLFVVCAGQLLAEAAAQAPLTQAAPLAQALPHVPQFDGSEVSVSQYVPQSVPEPQVSVSSVAPILYSTSRFASAPVFDAHVEPVRKMDCRVAPAAKVISIGPLSDQ
jgi:hypothetical protein